MFENDEGPSLLSSRKGHVSILCDLNRAEIKSQGMIKVDEYSQFLVTLSKKDCNQLAITSILSM